MVLKPVKLKYQLNQAPLILSVGIKYSVRGVLCDVVNYS